VKKLKPEKSSLKNYQEAMATILESGLNLQKDKGLVSPT